jgi:hypothetical protein
LRWHTGNPTLSVLIGLGCGAGTAVVLLALVEAATGQVSGDSRVAFMVSDGSLSRILVAVLIGVVAAPLVEEILFRGLFAESLRSFGTPIAILASAVAFAAWHLNPAALRYYALLGALLGLLYWKRGLIASMTAHATFNGILTAVTIASVLAPGHTYTVDRLAVHAPSGWSTDNNGGFDLLLVGPADAQFGVDARTATLADSQDAQSVLTHLETVPTAQAALRLSSARFISLRPGTALEVDIADQPGAEAIYIPEHGMVYIVTYATAGNAQALDDVNRMLDSLTVG